MVEEAVDGTDPAIIHVMGRLGYVWDAAAAHRLRRVHGLVGPMIGGVAAFKQQNGVHGLPMELSEEEVTLAVERGWGVLQSPAIATAQRAAHLQATSRKRPRDHMGYCEADSDEEEGGSNSDWDPTAPLPPEPEWRPILSGHARLVVPDTPETLAAAMPGAAAAAAAAGGPPPRPPGWSFPASTEERHRYWVFRELHDRGYRITGGSKFGADYLVYPGDPTLYHAQFCVRLVAYRQPLLAANLAAATRGSAMARKHLLLASVVEGEDLAEPATRPADGSTPAAASHAGGVGGGGDGAGGEGQYRVNFITLGPVDGFGG